MRGNEREMRKKMISLVQSGVQLIVLLALNDDGAPFYDKENAQFLAELGVLCLPVPRTSFRTDGGLGKARCWNVVIKNIQ